MSIEDMALQFEGFTPEQIAQLHAGYRAGYHLFSNSRIHAMSIEDMALQFEGFTPEQIAQLHAVLPDLQHLMGVVKAELPRINKIIPVMKMAVDVVNANQKRFS